MKRICVLSMTAIAVAACGSNDSQRGDDSQRELYRTTFRLGPDYIVEARPTDRSAKSLDLVGEDGTCGGGHPRRRLHRVDVRYDRDALVITAWMWREPMKNGVDGCAGVGISFAHRLRLAEPIGERGIIDAGFSRGEPSAVELEPRGRAAKRRLRQRYHVYN